MKYYLNANTDKKYRFVYNDEDNSVLYSRTDLHSEYENIVDSDVDIIKLKVLGHFERAEKLVKSEHNVGKFVRLLGTYRLHLEDDRYVSVTMSLYVNKKGKLKVKYRFSFSSVNLQRDFKFSKSAKSEMGFTCVPYAHIGVTACIMRIPVQMGYWLINMSDTQNEDLVHQFDDLMCMNLGNIICNWKVVGYSDINWR